MLMIRYKKMLIILSFTRGFYLTIRLFDLIFFRLFLKKTKIVIF